MRPPERVCYRQPLPRSRFLEFLAIDDHIGAMKVTRKELAEQAPLRDTTVFQRADAGYTRAKLVQHQGKRWRGVTTGTFLGCEVDGLLGFAGAPRHRVGLLSACTALVAYRGSCTPDLLSVLLGCWVHVLMYRRPGLCILDASFSAGIRFLHCPGLFGTSCSV